MKFERSRASTIRLFSWAILAFFALAACGKKAGPTLTIDVVTGLVAGPEFSQINVTLLQPGVALNNAMEEHGVEIPVTLGQSFEHGKTVATFTDEAPGDKVVRVQLVRSDGSVLVQRRVSFRMTTNYITTIFLNHDCVGVMCPVPGGSAALTECLAATCVDSRCDPNDPTTRAMYCPAVNFCNNASECAPVNACAEQTCLDGVCVPRAKSPSTCNSGEFCDSAEGCLSVASPWDGGVDAALEDAGTDAMPSLDADVDATMDAATDAMIDAAMDATLDATMVTHTPTRHADANLASGWSHSCEAQDDGTVVCWGQNQFGQLGTGDVVQRFSPAQVLVAAASPLQHVVQVVASGYTSCARKRDGTVWCWGSDSNGQLGDDEPIAQQNFAVQVSGIANAVSIVAGYQFGCAILADRTMACWGANGAGQLGIGDGTGTPSDHHTPIATPNIANVSEIAAGTAHVCAILYDNNVYCWGSNSAGQLGDSSMSSRSLSQPTPTQYVVAFTSDPAIQITAGNSFTCGLAASGAIYCWGDNAFGQLGTGSFALAGSTTSVPTLAISNVESIAANSSGSFACARTTGRVVYCWGQNNNGEVGNGSTSDCATPTAVVGTSSVNTFGLGVSHVVTLSDDGTEHGWGRNDLGQLGAGDATPYESLPRRGSTLRNVTSVVGGGKHTCTISGTAKSVSCWGQNTYGQLCSGSIATAYSPVAATGLTNVRQLALGAKSTFALKDDGTVWTCGANDVYRAGTGGGTAAIYPTPTQVPGLSNITSIGAGAAHACAIDNTGALFCWGANGSYQVGIVGTPTTPQHITTAPANLQMMVGGYNHTCVMNTANQVYCWGSNAGGQLGGGGFSALSYVAASAAHVTGIGTMSDVPVTLAAGGDATGGDTCAVTQSGVLYCWGANSTGQLAAGDLAARARPVVIPIAPASAVAMSDVFGCAALVSGGVTCWGDNNDGELGNAMMSSAPSLPVVATGISGATGITVGNFWSADYRACALVGGAVSCWGETSFCGAGLASVSATGPTQTWSGWY